MHNLGAALRSEKNKGQVECLNGHTQFLVGVRRLPVTANLHHTNFGYRERDNVFHTLKKLFRSGAGLSQQVHCIVAGSLISFAARCTMNAGLRN